MSLAELYVLRTTVDLPATNFILVDCTRYIFVFVPRYRKHFTFNVTLEKEIDSRPAVGTGTTKYRLYSNF
eukprot:SAG11_NODE_532_length_8707_cov_11.936578_4_plen_70_part_00